MTRKLPPSVAVPNRRLLCILAATLAAAACSGVPLRSLPKLSRLGATLLEADPADFALANQVDKRMLISADAAPVLVLKVSSPEAKGFPSIDRRLQLALSSDSPQTVPPAGAGRIWLVYSFTQESQHELLRLRQAFRDAKLPAGSSVSIGIEQEGLAAKNPNLASTEWRSWIRTSRKEGFFELWVGTTGDLLKHADK